MIKTGLVGEQISEEREDAENDDAFEQNSQSTVTSQTEHDSRRNSRAKPLEMMKLTYDVDNDEGPTSPVASPNMSFNMSQDECAAMVSHRTANIGEFTTPGIVSLEYCARVIAGHFLLTGVQGGLVSDSEVRVSLKSLAVACLSNLVQLYPKALLVELCIVDASNGAASQPIWEVIEFSKHSDPQLRGQTAILIASFLSTVLKNCNSYNEYLIANCSTRAFSDAPSIDELLSSHLFKAVFDTEQSSVAIKHGLIALQSCVIDLVKCDEGKHRFVIALTLTLTLTNRRRNRKSTFKRIEKRT